MTSRLATIAIVAVLLVFPSLTFAGTPTADDEKLYADTIATMRDLPEPPFVTFLFDVTLQGKISTALLDRHGRAIFRIWTGGGTPWGQPSGSWATSHRASDDLSSIANRPHSHLLSRSPLFNPTWTGAYDWLRYGIEPPPKPAPPPSAASDEQLKVIGMVKALGPSSYRISAAGPAVCPGGEPGRHLQLAARNGDIKMHPLADVVIEIAHTRFCSMRFHAPAVEGVSFAELHFGAVHGYWMTTSIDMNWHGFGQFGIGGERASWHVTYDGMRFPDALDDALFRLPDVAEEQFDATPYLRAQRLVDIGGRRLNVYCTGSGSPTVLLDANESDDTSSWRFVQPFVAQHTQVCSYDRAGFGFSDPGPLPRDAAATVADLRALLDKAAIARPVVLVGYSSSTLSARLYADRHLDELAGLVLVEPDIEDQEPALFSVAPALEPIFAEGTAAAKACTAAAEHGALKPGTEIYGVCTEHDEALPASLAAVKAQRQARAEWWRAYNSDQTSDRTISPAELRNEQRQYGRLPLTVVAASDVFLNWPLPPDQHQAARKFMRDFTAPLTRYSSAGSRVEVDGCDHGDIITRCASSVAAAIDKVVDDARRAR
ncbi:MAG TPA: alpha/beta fold hydrolase [Candidatus Limnocylindrales bacterium]|nr:alpha/beta fold hydrolase [Candidatus Limnocylindrales bacterium]